MQNLEEEIEGMEHEMAEAFPEQSMQYNLAEDGSLIPASNEEGDDATQSEEESEETESGRPAIDLMANMRGPRQMSLSRGPVGGGLLSAGAGAMGAAMPATADVGVDKAGRNDPCPCGSGKKYKKCHGS
jgi:uncharacterized protein YecA (UPF0149 family)